MVRRKKVLIFGGLILVLALGLVGCSGSNSSNNSEDIGSGQKLTVKVIGCGQVTKTPDQKRYDKGTEVTLKAAKKADFKAWTGDLDSESSSESIVMDNNYQVIANFYSKFVFKNGNKLYTINDNGGNLTEVTNLADKLTIKDLYYLPGTDKIVFVGEKVKVKPEIETKVYDQELYSVDIYKGIKKQITETKSEFKLAGGDWQLDRRQLLVVHGKQNSATKQEIYKLDLLDQDKAQLTNNNRLEAEAVWGPDGEQIAFTAVPDEEEYQPDNPEQGGNLDLYLMTAAGKEVNIILDTKDSHIKNISWFYNNKILFAAQKNEGEQEYYLLNADGSNQLTLKEYFDLDKSIKHVISNSERGKLILTVKEKEKLSYYLADLAGKRTIKLRADFSQPVFNWGPKNKHLLIEEQGAEENKLYLANADSGQVEQLAAGHSGTWLETGEEFIFLKVKQDQPQEVLYKYNLTTDQAKKLNEDFNSVKNLKLLN